VSFSCTTKSKKRLVCYEGSWSDVVAVNKKNSVLANEPKYSDCVVGGPCDHGEGCVESSRKTGVIQLTCVNGVYQLIHMEKL
jgi:hypothetical protein